jgi:hypothetical protein
MANSGTHFLLTSAARDFSLDDINRLSDQQVVQAFAQLRWGLKTQQICPACGVVRAHRYMTVRRQWRCRELGCSHTFSVTSGTMFHDHKLPLRKLLMGIVVYVNSVKGISSLQFSRILGVSHMAGYMLLGKFREALLMARDVRPLANEVQMDAGHFGGRPRKQGRKKTNDGPQLRTKMPQSHPSDHPNRRIVMVLRQVGSKRGQGALRTVVEIVCSEEAVSAKALVRRYVSKHAKVTTDEHGAYAPLAAMVYHRTVNHAIEFASEDGSNTNQAESFFSRARRMVIGQIHRITPKFMLDYVNEVAWREDMRRRKPSGQAAYLVSSMLQLPQSRWWRGYSQGRRRADELLFNPAAP